MIAKSIKWKIKIRKSKVSVKYVTTKVLMVREYNHIRLYLVINWLALSIYVAFNF